MVLPAPVGPDDGDRLAGLGHERQVLDERPVGVVGERHVARTRPGPHRRRAAALVGVGRLCSSASRNSRTRSSEAMPDWNTFIIDASWVSGIENWREYWMKACTSPTRDGAAGHPQAADHGDDHVLQVAEEHRRRLHQARHELRRRTTPRRARRWSSRKRSSTSCWRPNAFTMAWPVKVSSICALSSPVLRPLGDEPGPGPLGDDLHRPQTTAGTVVSATSASSGEIVNIITGDADQQQHRREHLAQRLLQALGHVVDVVGDPAEQVAAGLAGRCSASGRRVELVLGRRPAAGTSAAARRRRACRPMHEAEHGGDRRRGRRAS